MPDTSGPWDSAAWAEADWYRHLTVALPSGVHLQGSSIASATDGPLAWSATGLTITPAAGRANVAGAGYVRTATLTSVTVTANSHATFNRRDRVVLRRSLSTHTVTLAVLTGTAASTPVNPALTRTDTVWELPLFSFLVPPSSGTTLTGVTDERVWAPDPAVPTYGKVWRTSGFSASMSQNTANAITFDTSRVSGGVTFNGTTALVLPFDGFYRLTLRSYFSGPAANGCLAWISRDRGGSATAIVNANAWKGDSVDTGNSATDVLPLKAGDLLKMFQNPTTSATNTYWGTSEFAGVLMLAEYVGPLNETTPV